MIRSISKEAYGFEKIAYLLLFGEYPDSQEEERFFEILGEARELPQNFTRDVIMKAPTKDIMNTMTRKYPDSLPLTTAVPRPTPWKTISARQFSYYKGGNFFRFGYLFRSRGCHVFPEGAEAWRGQY